MNVTLEKHAPSKKPYARANQAPYMNKKLSKEIIKRSRLRNKFLNKRGNLDRKAYNKQRNYVISLLRKEKNFFHSNLNTNILTENRTFWKTVKSFLTDKTNKISRITLITINDMPQAVTCDLLLYSDYTCLVFQHKDVIEIETVLNKNFSSLCDWFIDNKLSIHFGEEKTKSILFSNKHKVKKYKPLNIHYKNIKIKQYSKVTYLGCILDETLSGESMAIHVINKINSR